MTKEQSVLPLTDIVTEMQKQLHIRLEPADMNNEAHMRVVHRLNEFSAEQGQVSIITGKPEPDSAETERAWAEEKFGYFRLVIKNGEIAGAVWSLVDSNTADANRALQQAEVGIVLNSDSGSHREASSSIFPEITNGDQVEADATLFQLVEEFGLLDSKGVHVHSIATYMDGVTKADRRDMKRIGFAQFADGVLYEGMPDHTVFVATAESTKDVIFMRAKKMGITGTQQPPAARK